MPSGLTIDGESSRLSIDTRTTWQTEDETQFIEHLPADLLALYAPIVLEDFRRWDKSIDVESVKSCVRDCLAEYAAKEVA